MHKFSEISKINSSDQLMLYSTNELGMKLAQPEENGASYEENSKIKALYYSKYTKDYVIADDTGLEVAILNGVPGIHSARYLDGVPQEEKNRSIIQRVLEKNRDGSDAQFISVVTIARSGKFIKSFRGVLKGKITALSKGTGGFGYDPIFFLPEKNCTLAELSMEGKNKISHRGISIRSALEYLENVKF